MLPMGSQRHYRHLLWVFFSKIHSTTYFKVSLSLFFGLVSYFVLCFACLQQDSYSHRGIFLPDKRKKEKEKEKSEQFPTYIMKKSRQFAPHCGKLSKTRGTSNWFHEKAGLV